MGMRPVRKLVLVALAAAAGLGLVYAFLPGRVEVETQQVVRGLMRVTVDEDGKTRIKERYIVSAPLAGRLLRIVLDPGDPVVAGNTLVASIEPADPSLLDVRARAEAEARVKAAEAARLRALASLEKARQAHGLSEHDYARARRLLATGGVSREEYDRTEHQERMAAEELRAAQFAVQVAEFEREQARAALLRTQPSAPGASDPGRFDIPSPIDGRVLQVFQESATVVTPGLRLLEVGDPADLEAVIDVLSDAAVKVRPGARVLLEHWGGARPLHGRVRLVEPAGFTKVSALGVEEQRVNVIVDFEDRPEERPTLGDAYRVVARIVVWEGADVLKVAEGALFRHAGGWAVYVLESGRARLRVVRTGQGNGLEAEVLEGLAAGDTVLVYPSDRVRDGTAVVSRRFAP